MAFTKKDLAALGDALDRVLRPFIGGNIKASSIFSDLYNETTEALTLYVDGSLGNDNNPGTALAPFRTIQAAVNAVPKTIKHPVLITVAAGNYTGFIASNFTVDLATDGGEGGTFMVSGTMGAATLASGLQTGSVASATAGSLTTPTSTWGTMTVTGAGWTVSDLRCKFVRILTGTGAGQIKAIYDNTATVITVTSSWTTAPDATSTFDIVMPATVLNDAVNVPAEFSTAGVLGTPATDLGCAIFTGGRVAGVTNTSVVRTRMGVRWMSMTAGSGSVVALNSDRVGAYACNFASNFNGILSWGAGSAVIANECVSTKTGGSFTFAQPVVGSYNELSGCVANGIAAVAFTSQGARLTVQTSAFTNLTSASAFNLLGSMSNLLVTTSIFSGNGGSTTFFGMNNSGAQLGGFASVGTCQINNFGTAFSVRGNAQLQCSSLTGTGNTTVFNLSKGVALSLSSDCTITGTNEIVLDGAAAVTIASMRAASPKILRDTNYQTRIYE